MNIYSISDCLPALEEIGVTMDTPERIKLELGLLRLTELANADQLLFWGKINTLSSPYYIAMAIDLKGHYAFPHKKFFYASSNLIFEQLPMLDEFNRGKVEGFCHLPFEGDAKKVLVNIQGEEGGENKEEEKKEEDSDEEDKVKVVQKNLTELDRLGYTVLAIENDCQVVPVNSFRMCEKHELRYNECFKGLKASQLTLKDFCHFRHPQKAQAVARIESADCIFSHDFLDSIEIEDYWALQTDTTQQWVTLRQLSWQGYVGFHRLHSPEFGGIYLGSGIKNPDMPFYL